MVRTRAQYLTDQLISNQLTRPELDELLMLLGQDDALADISGRLEIYFNQLLEQTDSGNDPNLILPPLQDWTPLAKDSKLTGSERLKCERIWLSAVTALLQDASKALFMNRLGYRAQFR